MKYRANPIRLREAWVLCFLLGVVMLNYPFIHIFNKTVLVFGIPLLILYLLLGWPISIAVIYLFVKSLDRPPSRPPEEERNEAPPLP